MRGVYGGRRGGQFVTALWILWIAYVLCWFGDYLYIQPYRKRIASEQGDDYSAGALSFGLRASLPLVTAVLVISTFAFDVYQIPTPSMEPTIPEGTTIWVNRTAYGIRSPLTGNVWIDRSEPEPGEIFVFQYPREPRTTYVKRVLGVPGDRIRVAGDRIYVNDRLLRACSESITC